MGNQSELWSAPMANKTARGPPPGLGNNNNNKGNLGGTNAITSTATSSSTNGWIGGNLRLSKSIQIVHEILYVLFFPFHSFLIEISKKNRSFASISRYQKSWTKITKSRPTNSHTQKKLYRFGFMAFNMAAFEEYDCSDWWLNIAYIVYATRSIATFPFIFKSWHSFM